MNENPFSVLIVDDSELNLTLISDMLKEEGYELGHATDGKQALEYISAKKPDLILLDVMMPEMDGYETCVHLKQHPGYNDIPIIFLTAKEQPEDIAKGFELGSVDYISKPFNSLELKSRVRTHLNLKRAQDNAIIAIKELNAAKRAIERQNKQLNRLVKEFKLISKTDYLTHLCNRRSMVEKLNKEVLKSQKNRNPFSVVMGDIDFFKKINDRYGHDFGDIILKEVANIMVGLSRKGDEVSRWGGEEFLILLSNTELKKAADFTEKLREKISEHNFIYHHTHLYLTMTFGVAEFNENNDIDTVIKKADNALYKGKNLGRNRVCVEE